MLQTEVFKKMLKELLEKQGINNSEDIIKVLCDQNFEEDTNKIKTGKELTTYFSKKMDGFKNNIEIREKVMLCVDSAINNFVEQSTNSEIVQPLQMLKQQAPQQKQLQTQLRQLKEVQEQHVSNILPIYDQRNLLITQCKNLRQKSKEVEIERYIIQYKPAFIAQYNEVVLQIEQLGEQLKQQTLQTQQLNILIKQNSTLFGQKSQEELNNFEKQLREQQVQQNEMIKREQPLQQQIKQLQQQIKQLQQQILLIQEECNLIKKAIEKQLQQELEVELNQLMGLEGKQLDDLQEQKNSLNEQYLDLNKCLKDNTRVEQIMNLNIPLFSQDIQEKINRINSELELQIKQHEEYQVRDQIIELTEKILGLPLQENELKEIKKQLQLEKIQTKEKQPINEQLQKEIQNLEKRFKQVKLIDKMTKRKEEQLDKGQLRYI